MSFRSTRAVAGTLMILGPGLLLAPTAVASDLHWTGLADDGFDPPSGFFSFEDNWLELAVPGSSDAALFTLDDTYYVTFDVDPTIFAFEVTAGDVTFDGRGILHTFSLDEALLRNSQLDLNWLDLHINGPLALEEGATLTLHNHSITADSFTIDPAATFIHEDGTVEVNGNFINGGTWDQQAGTFTVSGGNFDPGWMFVIEGPDETTVPTVKLTDGTMALGMPTTNVGDSYNGALEIRSGSQWTCISGNIKVAGWYNPQGKSEGSLIITGPGTEFSGDLRIAVYGIGTMTVSDGASVDGWCIIGMEGGSDGTAIIEDEGTVCEWSELDVGCSGTGLIEVRSGADVNLTGSLYLGVENSPHGYGTVRVTGVGSTLSVPWGELCRMGDEGTGEMYVEDGAVVSIDDIDIASCWPSGSGDLTVDGVGSHLQTRLCFQVGGSGTGYLRILNGATAEAADCDIADYGTGSVIVDGAGSTLTILNDLNIAEYDGPSLRGTLDLYNGGVTNVGETLTVYDGGKVRLHDGTLNANTIVLATSGAEFESFGGTLICNVFDGDLQNDGVTIKPDGFDNVGTMQITNDFVQLSGTLAIERDPVAETNDLLQVDGMAVLGGTLEVTLLPMGKGGKGRAPFTVLTSGVAVSGEFDEEIVPPGYAVEYQSHAVVIVPGVDCPGDLNGDGLRNQSDLGILLASYGINAGGDIDGDGDTDQSDLGILLSVYNVPCP